MVGRVSSPTEPFYDILIEDADGRHLWLEGVPDLETARVRMPALAAQYSGMRLILWNHKTRTIVASTEGY
jgi:hypothetical protein